MPTSPGACLKVQMMSCGKSTGVERAKNKAKDGAFSKGQKKHVKEAKFCL